MSRIVIRGGRVITPTEERFTDVVVDGGEIQAVGSVEEKPADATIIDASGCYVTPGLIDLQVNGAPSCNFWADPTKADVSKFAQELVKAGVTTILPTLITDDLDHLRKNIDFLEKEMAVGDLQQGDLPVRMPGIHLEGPCLSPERPGVHPKQHIKPLSVEVVKKIAGKSVKLVTCAPETDAKGEALGELRSRNIEVALGHSNATYEEANAAFDRGVKMMTHTYNALPPIHHRAPGAVTAALLDNRVMCCLICDGHHVSAPAAQLVLRTKGVKRTILVTDVAAVGTSQGGLVGASILLDEAIRNVVSWGIATFSEAILMSTLNPAKAMGWDAKIGSLAPGKLADIVVWDRKTMRVKNVIARGKKVV
jgi:N-acetylglucosamine-6-phosphate deacetylase